ncbi:MAG: tetratricopeptide repeat protein [Candidatus Rokubacteria bacterium]|nr:tetratricopeptide repeat protein [Candidatus Rokubacteria bacterium]
MIQTFRELVSHGRRLLERVTGPPSDIADPETSDLVRRARAAHAAGRRDDEAALLHEAGHTELAHGRAASALAYFRAALRVDRDFLPSLVALGDAYEAAGERREAVRAWERAAETHAALPLLGRLERAYRDDGRPSRMIALYQEAAARASDDLGLAMALGRVYLELEMLDEAADQFEKLEVRAPDLPLVHAYLGQVFERRGDTAEAFEEYRRALRLGHTFEWPHVCAACGATSAGWRERCERCRRWNAVQPARG